jgi:hypothetical protein
MGHKDLEITVDLSPEWLARLASGYPPAGRARCCRLGPWLRRSGPAALCRTAPGCAQRLHSAQTMTAAYLKRTRGDETVRPWLPASVTRFVTRSGRTARGSSRASFPRYCHAPRRAPSFGVALRPASSSAPRCAAPSEATETTGVSVVLRGRSVGAPDTIRTYDLGFRKARFGNAGSAQREVPFPSDPLSWRQRSSARLQLQALGGEPPSRDPSPNFRAPHC